MNAPWRKLLARAALKMRFRKEFLFESGGGTIFLSPWPLPIRVQVLVSRFNPPTLHHVLPGHAPAKTCQLSNSHQVTDRGLPV